MKCQGEVYFSIENSFKHLLVCQKSRRGKWKKPNETFNFTLPHRRTLCCLSAYTIFIPSLSSSVEKRIWLWKFSTSFDIKWCIEWNYDFFLFYIFHKRKPFPAREKVLKTSWFIVEFIFVSFSWNPLLDTRFVLPKKLYFPMCKYFLSFVNIHRFVSREMYICIECKLSENWLS